MASFAEQLTELLPLRFRSAGDPDGPTTGFDAREFLTVVIAALDALEQQQRGNKVFTGDAGGLAPTDDFEQQEGDLFLDEASSNLWQWIDGEWVFVAALAAPPGTQILGGAAVPDNSVGNLGDWYFQYNVAAWQKTPGGWVNRFALGTGGTPLPNPIGQNGKVLASDGTANPAWSDVPGLSAKAPINNPSLTGSVTAPTPTSSSNNTLVATTAWVVANVQAAVTTAIANVVGMAPANLDTLVEIAAALNNSSSGLAALLTNVAGRLSIASNLADLNSASAARGNLGLGNVNNTSDANKPVSTAQQTALDGKQNVDVHSVLAYGTGSLALDFAADSQRTVNLTGNLTITGTSNRAATKNKIVRLVCDGTARTLAFPSGWVWQSITAPTSIAAGKTAVLSLLAFGPNETDVVATYSVQP